MFSTLREKEALDIWIVKIQVLFLAYMYYLNIQSLFIFEWLAYNSGVEKKLTNYKGGFPWDGQTKFLSWETFQQYKFVKKKFKIVDKIYQSQWALFQ